MKNSQVSEFIDVTQRLKDVLSLSSDRELVAALGIRYSTFTMRKSRGALPTEHIDALISREGLNPEFVYRGTGKLHLEDDEHKWVDGFYARLLPLFKVETFVRALQSAGHKATELKQLEKKKAAPALELLRDLRRQKLVDLNWLFTGEAEERPNPNELTLLKLYRSAPAEKKNAVLMELIAAQQE